MKSLSLSVPAWDLMLDSESNIATLENSPAILQDVASAVRVYLGECYYDTGQGISYDSASQTIDPTFLEEEITSIAQNVPGVASCQVMLATLTQSRVLGGSILIKTNNNETIEASL